MAASSPERLDRPDLWDTGRVKSSQSLDVIYGGRNLKSRQTVSWRVRVWDAAGRAGAWSEPATFAIGLLKPSDWSAKWIGRLLPSKEGSQPCPFLRRAFQLGQPIKQARLYVTARGLFELHLNGQRLNQDYFTPGWTDYHKRIQYLTYDVTSALRDGSNVIGAVLGDGWYSGQLFWEKKRFVYGEQNSLLLQLEVDYANGRRDVIKSGPEWKTAFGPILKSDILDGESYDARRELTGWSTPDFDDSQWQHAIVFPAPKATLVAARNLPVRKQEELPAQILTEPNFGTHIFDLGQNMVGWVRLKVRAPEGQTIRIRHAEMLQDDGTLYTANLRKAQCTDYYTCKGTGEEVYEPRFTFHGFRYVEVTGVVEKPQLGDVTGIVLHSEISSTGSFECSDSLVNRLQQNIVWGQKGNFLDIPTDCPQRDERLGWTGDAQVFIRTACFNRDVAAFFTKWCIDLEDSQFANGAFPHVAPDPLRDGNGGCAAWSDAGVVCPWTVYLCYGDKAILARHFRSMQRWIGWRVKNSPGLICTSACFGDWLSVAYTPGDLIATAYFAHTANLVSQIAAILGRKKEAREYAALFKRVKDAFNDRFVSHDGLLVGDSQTSYLLALGFDLLPEALRPRAVERLVKDIKNRKWRLSTGFVGTPLLAPVLSRFGHTDVAYKLLLQKEYQSWLYTVLQGATTMWERWNSYGKDRGFGEVSMNSFNHYAYGAIGEWMYNTVAGIELDPADPGYKHIIIRPQPGAELTWVKAELMTRYGKVSSGWKRARKKLTVNVTIPPNTHATIILPGRKPQQAGAGTYKFVVPDPIR